MSEKQVQRSKDFLAKHPDLVSNFKKTDAVMNISSSSSSSAPALSSYNMYFVATSYDKYTDVINGYEMIKKSQTTTVNDFNGTIYVGTLEYGYGQEQANFNETLLGSKYDSIPLDNDGDKIIDTFVDIWKIDNVTNGKFTSTSVSDNPNSSGKYPVITANLNIL